MLLELQLSGPSTSLIKSIEDAALGKNSRRLFPPNANVLLVVTVCQKKLPASEYFLSPLSSPILAKPIAFGTCVLACLLSRLSIPSDIGFNNLWCENLSAATKYFLFPDIA